MYSTSITDNRCTIKCLMVAEKVTVNQFVVDTGAKMTCCKYSFIDRNLNEKDYANCDVKSIGGIIEGDRLKFYKYHLKQFTVGNIDMGERDIWITFDNRITDIVLGMDILKDVIMIINSYDGRVYFCKDKDDYESNFRITSV